MIFRKAGFAGLALACALSLGLTQPVRAQEMGAQQSDDSANWQAPRGYDEAYPESGKPNMVARQGYAAGFNQGQADASRGKKFKPTESEAYGKAKIPQGMDKEAFKQEFREAFVKGYSNGYKGETH
jgi:hypothetical protein